MKYGHQLLADQLPELRPVGSTTDRQEAGHMEVFSSGSSTSILSSLSQVSSSQTIVAAGTEESTSNTNQVKTIQADIPIVPSDDMTTPRGDSSNMSISETEAADIELELNELPSPDQQE